MAACQHTVPSHTYTVGHVMLFVTLVLDAATSLRGASRVMVLIMAVFHLPLATPSWFTGRLWLLRLGYYKLTRPKEQADDWVWIVDHTVQLGPEKCLVILGIRLRALPVRGICLRHEDVEPIAVCPVTQSNGEVVYQQLEASGKKTGIPRAIISDHGSDLKAGVEKFCHEHAETSSIYDIKHKTAAVLKRALQEDTRWHAFTHEATQTKNRVQQTALAFLAPPNQRTKARYMNIESLITWGRKTLTFLDTHEREGAHELPQDHLEAQLGWLRGFREQLQEWGELLAVIAVTESFVRTQGLYRGAQRELKALLAPLARLQRTKKVGAHLVAFVAGECLKVKPSERLLGSSEVIESVFGKVKRLEQDQAKSGLTGLILSVAAMVSTTTTEVIQKALATVSTQQVLAWCKKTLGPSVQAKRKKALAPRRPTEQKRDQFQVAV